MITINHSLDAIFSGQSILSFVFATVYMKKFIRALWFWFENNQFSLIFFQSIPLWKSEYLLTVIWAGTQHLT